MKRLILLLISVILLTTKIDAATLTQKLGNEYISTTVEPGETVNMEFISKLGYQFKNWVVEAGGISIDTSNPEISFEMPNKNVIIRGNYDASYTIAFNKNGGTGSIANIIVPAGGSKTLPLNTFTKMGYNFKGWALEANGEVEYDNEEEISPTENMTLYAVWGTTMLAAGETWYTQGGTSIAKSSITSIEIKDSYTPTGTPVASWDASEGECGTVTAYVENDGLGNGTYKLTLAGDGSGKIYANANSTAAFRNFVNVTSITGFKDGSGNVVFDTSNVTLMLHMFQDCTSLISLDLSGFNTSNVGSMYNMFYGCSGLTNLDVSSFNTSQITTMHCMFYNCSSLASLNISNFDTAKVTSMQSAFQGCTALTNLTLGSINTSNVTNMSYMFRNCSNLTSLNVSSFDTSNVTNMSYMFRDCSKLLNLDVSNFNTQAVTSMKNMFNGCSSLTALNLSNFSTGEVTDMDAMFYNCTNLETLNVSSFNTSNVTTMYAMFANCSKVSELNVSGFNTGNVTNMISMFFNCNNLEAVDVSDFETGKVTSMARMFYACRKLTSLDLSNFNTSAITSSGYDAQSGSYIGLARFAWDCPVLTTIILGENFGQSTNLPVAGVDLGMFYLGHDTDTIISGANAVMTSYDWVADKRILPVTATATLASQGTWYTQGGTSIAKSSITTIEIKDSYTPAGTVDAQWDASDGQAGTITAYVEGSKLTLAGNGTGKIYANADSKNAFRDFTNVTSITGFKDGNNVVYDTSNVTTMYSIFSYCQVLESVDVTGFDTSNVTTMQGMFNYCQALESVDVSGFNTSKVTSMAGMFQQCNNIRELNLSNFDTSKVTLLNQMFNRCYELVSINVSSFDTSDVTNMEGMFQDCQKLSTIDVSDFDTSNVISMKAMFNRNVLLEHIDVSGFNTSNVTNMEGMFQNCQNLSTIDVSNFVTSNITSMSYMFNNCSSLTSLDLSKFNTSGITSNEYNESTGVYSGLARFAYNCTALTTITLGPNFGQSTNVPAAGNSTGMFYVSSNTNTTVTGANEVMTSYDWVADHRVTSTYTITFDSNGGEGEIESITVPAGESIVLPIAYDVLTHPDAWFLHWSTDPSGMTGDYYYEGGTVTPTGDMTFYAIWDTGWEGQ